MRFYRLQNDHYFNKKRIADMDVVSDVARSRQSVLKRVVIRFFLTWRYPLNNSGVI